MQKNSYHHGNLREDLLKTALELLSNNTPEYKITLRKLSEMIGVSRTAPYRHFHSKSALMSAVAARGFTIMRSNFRQTELIDDPEESICRLMEDYLTFATENHLLYKLMFSNALLEAAPLKELEEEAERTFSTLSKILVKLNPSLANSSESSAAVWAMVHGISTLANEKLLSVSNSGRVTHSLINRGHQPTGEETKAAVASAVRLLIRGIGPPESQQTRVQKNRDLLHSTE